MPTAHSPTKAPTPTTMSPTTPCPTSTPSPGPTQLRALPGRTPVTPPLEQIQSVIKKPCQSMSTIHLGLRHSRLIQALNTSATNPTYQHNQPNSAKARTTGACCLAQTPHTHTLITLRELQQVQVLLSKSQHRYLPQPHNTLHK